MCQAGERTASWSITCLTREARKVPVRNGIKKSSCKTQELSLCEIEEWASGPFF